MSHFRRSSRTLAFVLGVMVAVALPGRARAQFIYVNNNIGGTNSISGFSVGTGGTLTLLSGSPFLTGGGGSFSTNVGAASIVVTKQRLYASNAITNTIAAFDINTDGSLTTIPGSPFPTLGTTVNGIAINSTGTMLFSAQFASNQVSVFNIASNGALTLVPSTPFAVAAGPLDLQINPTNSLLFASQDTLGVGVYSIGGGGSLTAIGGSPFAAGGHERGLAIDAAATLLYVADHTANTVSGFTIGGGGTLSVATGSPFGAGTGPSGVLFHPSLSVLYVSNDGGVSGDIDAFSIGGGGALSALGGSPFASGGVGTSGMVIDPAHKRLFAINGSDNAGATRDVSVFTIGGTGALTAVGGSPFSTGVGTGRPSSIVLASVCPAAQQSGCLTAAKSSLSIKNTTPDTKDTLTWKWSKGVPTTQDDFGLPVLTRTYALCVYDTTGLVLSAEVSADAMCSTARGTVPCWSTVRFTGIKYKDKAGASDGVTAITCKGSTVNGKSSITFKGKGTNLPDPTLPLSGPVTAQFINTDSGICFTGTYSGAGITKNDGVQFKGKAP